MFHGPPRFGGGASSLGPPPKGRCFDFLRGAKRAIFAPKSGQKWPNFPARAKGARGIPQRAYNGLQIGSNLHKNGSKTQKLLQKCPWWRKSVHIASKTLKTTLKYVKTALRAPKARAKNFSQNLAPSRIFIWGGGRAPSLARPLHETLEYTPRERCQVRQQKAKCRDARCRARKIVQAWPLFLARAPSHT